MILKEKNGSKECLSKNEGLLIYFFFSFSAALATYILWITNIRLLLLFWGSLCVPFYLYRHKVCITCENKCPFNPKKSFWKRDMYEDDNT